MRRVSYSLAIYNVDRKKKKEKWDEYFKNSLGGCERFKGIIRYQKLSTMSIIKMKNLNNLRSKKKKKEEEDRES